MNAQVWSPMASAPKSTAIPGNGGTFVRAIYLLGFCPEEGAAPESCIEIVWWEPAEKGGHWTNGHWDVAPTHWMALPKTLQVAS